MTDAAAILSAFSERPEALSWLCLVAVQVLVFARAMFCRTPIRKAKRKRIAAARTRIAGPSRITLAEQMNRLVAVIEKAIAAAERAIFAHVTAARHIDSAEYQLCRLFEDHPLIASVCNRPTLASLRHAHGNAASQYPSGAMAA